MAKNQQTQNSSRECQELYIARSWPAHSLMSSGPATAPSQTFPVSATTSHAFRLKAAARQVPSSGELIPIEIDPHLLPTVENFNKNTAKFPDPKSKIKQEAPPTYVRVEHQKKLSTVETTRTQETIDDKFTAYINRVRHGMLRTLSNVESAEISSLFRA